MSDLNFNIMSFETFLEDTKSLSDANHHIKNGDQAADKLAEPAEHKIDKNGIATDANHSKANKMIGDKAAAKLTEGKDDDQEDDDQEDDGDKKKVADEEEEEGDDD